MKTNPSLLLVALVALAPLGALASTDAREAARDDLARIDRKLEQCLSTPEGQSNQGMIRCTSDAYGANDRVLNRVYQEIVMELKSNNDRDSNAILDRLQKSQRIWIQHRDANSDLQATSMLGGSGEPLMKVSSLNSMVRARVLELVELFEQR